MKTGPAVLVAIAAVILLFASTTPAQRPQPGPAQPGTFEAKVESYLEQFGYEFHKVKNNSWYLLIPGKEMAQIRIILGAGPSSIAMMTAIASPTSAQFTPEITRVDAVPPVVTTRSCPR